MRSSYLHHANTSVNSSSELDSMNVWLYVELICLGVCTTHCIFFCRSKWSFIVLFIRIRNHYISSLLLQFEGMHQGRSACRSLEFLPVSAIEPDKETRQARFRWGLHYSKVQCLWVGAQNRFDAIHAISGFSKYSTRPRNNCVGLRVVY